MTIPPKSGDNLANQWAEQLTKGLTQLMENAVKQQKITKPKAVCTHTDGAIQVAQYIVEEIKRNTKSQTADTISYYIGDKYRERLKDWGNLDWWRQALVPMPEYEMLAALTTWFMAVNTDQPWDHKPKIRAQFKNYAVHRPTPTGAPSETYYHKYRDHDYFLDVWSNIHYGYVGLSVGFSEKMLLTGSDVQQFVHNLKKLSFGSDTIDDNTTMKIGFELYRRFGKYADNLTAQDVLNALEGKADNLLPVSRLSHWCWDNSNPNPAEKSTQ